ncbi:MAG: hypothetical protein H6983_12785 [Ectothiorhodospiraceae bacterium]|nr:hypothetical protein [Chromatiales bacterium]MCP5155039.1 hypothetical protein [Ectothiorhodospiraceae bacterium]
MPTDRHRTVVTASRAAERAARAELGRFERLMAVSVMLLLVTLGAEHILRLADSAERENVSATLATLRAALMLEAASRVIARDHEALGALEDSNPMRLLSRVPSSYVGELGPGEAPDRDGVWYFDAERREIVYQFGARTEGRPTLRHRVRLRFDDTDGNGRLDRADRFQAVRLEPVAAPI